MNTKAITPRGDTSWTPCRLRRGLFAAVFGLCGLAAPAMAQPGRTAVLLPPQAAPEREVRTIARGAIDDGLDTLATTPVPRKATAKPVSSGPAWLNQDTAVKPASGTSTFTVPVTESASPTYGNYITSMPDVAPKKPSMFSRGVQKLRNVFSSGEPIPVVPPGMTSLPPSTIPVTTTPVVVTPRVPVTRDVTPVPMWDTVPREVAMPPRREMAREMVSSQVEPTRDVRMPREMPREVVAPREAASATSPLQGVSPSGAPVLAGPPRTAGTVTAPPRPARTRTPRRASILGPARTGTR